MNILRFLLSKAHHLRSILALDIIRQIIETNGIDAIVV